MPVSELQMRNSSSTNKEGLKLNFLNLSGISKRIVDNVSYTEVTTVLSEVIYICISCLQLIFL